jgi:4'-phosphopantetheinyl transferase
VDDRRTVPAALRAGAIDLWQVDLSADLPLSAATVLSADERERAACLHFSEHRRRWTASRVALRTILAGYGSITPRDLIFAAGPYGKPSLSGTPDLRFNLSHSEDRALLAVAWRTDVGVDIEAVRPMPELAGVARLVFTEEERVLLFSRDVDQRLATFFVMWTRKEAYIKGTGLGMSARLATISVLPHETGGPRVRSGAAEAGCGGWSVLDLPAETGYRAALAVQGPLREVRSHRFPVHEE